MGKEEKILVLLALALIILFKLSGIGEGRTIQIAHTFHNSELP